jgi:hypothetical protein
MLGVKSSAGEIMNTKSTVQDDLEEFVDSNLAAVVLLLGTSREQATLMHCENKGPQQFSVAGVKGDIQKYLPTVVRHLEHLWAEH